MKTITELRNNTQTENKELQVVDAGVFSSQSAFAQSMQMARALCSSTLVPQDYRGEQNLGNTLIALEIAQRTGASPLMVMQNLYVVHGRPAWSAQFIIAALNACGRFSPLRFGFDKESMECHAWAIEKGSDTQLDGPKVSLEMAKAEGWYQKNGSKWKTMPEMMLRYRAASFFGKLYAPEILMGMQTEEEIIDISDSYAPVPQQEAPAETKEKFEYKISHPEEIPEPTMPPAEEWPREIPDENGEVRWADSSGAFFDENLHAWNARESRPGVKSDGSFRARRGAHKFQEQSEQEQEQTGSDDFGGME